MIKKQTIVFTLFVLVLVAYFAAKVDMGFNYSKNKTAVYYKDNVLPDADPDTFEVLMFFDERQKHTRFAGGPPPDDFRHIIYAKDKHSVYYLGNLLPNIDTSTFAWLGYGYVRDKDHLFYDGVVVENGDPDTFNVVDGDRMPFYMRDNYMRDKNHIIIEGLVVTQYDTDTFEIISHEYLRDKNHLYLKGEAVEGIDPATFEIVDYYHVKDKNHLYKVDSGKGQFTKIVLVDPNTFELFENSYYYSRDKNHVYQDYSVVARADPHTFMPLKGSYAKDENHVFYGRNLFVVSDFKGQPINPDARTFEIIDDSGSLINYSKDKDHVFFNDQLIEKADPTRFKPFDHKNHRDDYYKNYATDEKLLFYRGVVIEGADLNSFEVIDYYYSKDNAHVFYEGGALQGADVSSLEILNFLYAKNKAHVYFKGRWMNGVNPKGFVLVEGSENFAKNNEAVFFEGIKVDNADPKTFTKDTPIK